MLPGSTHSRDPDERLRIFPTALHEPIFVGEPRRRRKFQAGQLLNLVTPSFSDLTHYRPLKIAVSDLFNPLTPQLCELF
jgi:hypothetical protein